jgi:acetyl-CoA carboxylase biotin carboxyl carrier protein
MAILGFEFEEISRLLALMESSGLEELVWEDETRSLRITAPRVAAQALAEPPVHPAPSRRAQMPQRTSVQRAISPKSPAELPEDQIALVSPMVGVFYRAGKPGDPPLIEVGQRIARDQTIGIIEAMKIFSEVPAEHGGIVVAVPAQDGQLVQAGTPLVILKKEG